MKALKASYDLTVEQLKTYECKEYVGFNISIAFLLIIYTALCIISNLDEFRGYTTKYVHYQCCLIVLQGG